MSGLGLAGALRLGGVPDFVSISYFVVPLSISFATPDAPSTDVSNPARITLVAGQSGVLAASVTSRITSVR